MRLNGAALLCFAQSSLKAIPGTFGACAQQAAIFSAPFAEPPCSSTSRGAWRELRRAGPEG